VIAADTQILFDSHSLIQNYEERVQDLQAHCQHKAHIVDAHRDMLRLYCQQFAFAPTMVPACAALLSCTETQRHFDWAPFAGVTFWTYWHPFAEMAEPALAAST